jgi:GNAT superfamily N-acetyltransferase
MSDDRDENWPLAHESELELVVSDSLDLRFVAVADSRRCSVHAMNDLMAIGSLRWLTADPERDDDSGTITWIEVSSKHRRKGVATALLQAANEYATHYGLARPRHSDSRTRLGDAWATSLGARPAKTVLEDWSTP